jgi:hypothetical protein
MDYLTKHYMNLCEQRQQQIKVLEENLLRRGLYKVGDIVGQGIDSITRAKSGIGGMAGEIGRGIGEIGKGIAGAGQSLSDWGGRKQEEAQYSLERFRERDPRRIQHERAITDWMQGGGSEYNPQRTNIARVVEDAVSHLEGFRSHARFNADEAARERHPYKELKERKKPYTEAEFAKLDDNNRKILEKRRKLVDSAVADFDAKHGANIALGYIAAQLSKKSGEINADERAGFNKRYDMVTGQQEDRSGRTQHSGGHHIGHIEQDPYNQKLNPVEHSDVAAYRKWYNGGGHRVESAVHPDELFGHHTAHVDYAFESYLPDSSLQMANQRNRKAFDAAVETSKQLMSRPDPLEGQVSASGGIKTSTLRPAFESYSGSRKNLLNEKINKFLI